MENIIFFMYVIQAGKFIIFSLLLFYMFKLYSNSLLIAFLGFATFFIISDLFYFIPVFAHTIFPESSLLLLLVTFSVFYFHAKATDNLIYYICAILAMTYALYLKEPVLASFVVFGFMRLIFFRNEISKREKYFQYTVLLNCLIFLCAYYLLAYTSGPTYSEGRIQSDYFEFLTKILFEYKFIIPIVIACVRFCFVAIRKSKVMLADVFLLMSLANMSCFIVLFLDANYYFLPAYFLLWVAFALYFKRIVELKPVFIELWPIIVAYLKRNRDALSMAALCVLVLSLAIFTIREPLRRDFHNGAKIVSSESLKIMDEITKQDKEIYFYTFPRDEYKIPFHHSADSWVREIMRIPFENYPTLLSENTIITVENFSEFTNSLDIGNVGIISAISPQVEALLLEHPQYQLLDFDMGFLVVHKNYLASIVPLYCEFANNVEDTIGSRRKMTPAIKEMIRKAKELGCEKML